MSDPEFYGKSIRELIPDLERVAVQHRRVTLGNRQVRTYFKGQSHRAAALAGGGSREVARRARQLAKIAAK